MIREEEDIIKQRVGGGKAGRYKNQYQLGSFFSH